MKPRRLKQQELKDTAILFLPGVFCIAAVVIFPLAYSYVLSFTDTNLRSQGIGEFVGLENYITALTDEILSQGHLDNCEVYGYLSYL